MFQISLTSLSVEVLGYGFRASGLHEEYSNPSTYVTSTTLIIVAPAFVAATLYQHLAHVILASGRGSSSLILKLGLGVGFGALDVLAYALQAAGKFT
jgi:RTA1 like protein